jgi:hypothetical protein
VQEVYDFILADLKAALDLNSLPDKPVTLMRVGKAFALAVEAKVRMSIRDFDGAMAAATASLAIQNTLEDHRDCQVAEDMFGMPGPFFDRPMMKGAEDLFYSAPSYLLMQALTPEMVDAFEPGSILHNTIERMDYMALGMYGLSTEIVSVVFTSAFLNATGLSTVDMYLVQAECKLRANDVPGAMAILNMIREKRVDTYTAIPTTDASDAFTLLKQVTRTECWYGPKHFISLKRWNTEDAYKTTIRKTLLGENYELRPDSPLWVFPFPQNATGYNPNLTQNY